MRKNCLILGAASLLALVSVTKLHAQPYSNAVMALNPAGYWPLNETAQPANPLNITATNLGTLGTAGNGYYGAWYQPSNTTWFITNNTVLGTGITSDGDQALVCNQQAGQYVVVPRNANGTPNPALTIAPPFSVEVWVQFGATNGGNRNLVSQGQTPVNCGGSDPNNPFYGGLFNAWSGFALGQFQDYIYFSCFCTNAMSKSSELDTTAFNAFKGFKIGQWVQVVATFDGSRETIYTNGTQSVSKTVTANAAGLKYVPDPTSPLMIGNGNDVASTLTAFLGTLDEVAIYPEILPLTSIQTHYEAAFGTNAEFGNNYQSAVLADSPQLYYRLNDQQSRTNGGYPAASLPVVNNYGTLSSAANGVYQPGTTPGVAGPSYSGFGANSHAVALNGWFGQVDIGGGNLPASLNPTGAVPLTVISWFQTGPADSPGRFQEILGHGDNSYRLGLGQIAGENHFNPGPGPAAELQFTNALDVAANGFALNDGRWHMVAGVSDGTNEFMYLDGLLAKSNSIAGGINIVGSTNDLLLGGDSQYTAAAASSANTIRTFNGQIAQVAFFTNALSAVQIQQLYGAAAVPPTVFTQPPASVTNNSGANVTIPVGARGSAPLTYQWYRNDGTPVSGQITSALTFNPATTNNTGSYYVVVSNSAGSATSSIVQVTILGPPILSQQSLTDIRVFVGTTPALQVSASGPAPLIYQWKRNGVPITGATNSAYTVTNTSTVGSSTYDCTVTNSNGAASINPITVSVLAAPGAPFPATVLADHPIAFYRLDEGPDDGAGNSGRTAYDYAGGLNGSYSNVDLSQPGYSTVTEPSETSSRYGFFNFQDGYAGNVPRYLDFSKPNGNSSQFSVEAWINSMLIPSTDAGIVTIGYGFGGEQFALDCGAHVGSSRALRFYVNDAANGTHTAASANTSLLGDGQWHHLAAVCDQANGHVYIYIDGALSGSGTIPAGSGIRALSAPLSIGSRLSTSSATDYDNQFFGLINDVAVYNYALTPTQVANHYFGAGIAPTISQIQPAVLETNQGATAIFTLSAAGTPPLSYQWTDNNGVAIPWGTNATLAITNVQQSQAGYYTVTINNGYGSASTNGQLIVDLGAPAIVTDLQPTNQTVYSGVALTYSITVSGSSPFAYQWYKNGSPISGGTSSSYSFTSLVGTNTYYCAVTNAYSVSQHGGPTYSSTGTVVGVAAPTLDPLSYGYKTKITFNGYNRGEALADFPALIKFGTNIPGFAYGQLASPAGGDLRFTDSSGTREIPHEIDEWNPADTSTVWVQVPRLSGTNDFIWAYWGNATDTALPAYATNGSVWVPQSFENLPGYQVVYHLKEGAFPFADSTTVNPATNGVAPAATNGVVGLGGLFNGSAWLDAGTNNLDDAFTLSAWVNIPTGTSDIQTIWANQHGGFGAPGFALFVNTYQKSDQKIDLASGNGAGSGNESTTAAGVLGFGQWHQLQVAINRTNGTGEVYVDGTDVFSTTGVVRDFTSVNDLNLGRFIDGAFGMHGLLDEARIQHGITSSNWVWADYMTVANNSTFQTYGAVGSSGVTLNSQLTNGKLVLSWSQGTLQGASQVTGPYTDISSATSPYTNSPAASQQFFRVRVR
jgi:hypothetical protein